MSPLSSKRAYLVYLLVLLILIPYLLISVSLPVLAAEENSDESSWIKGILMLVVTFLLNNFFNKETDTDKPPIPQPEIETEKEVLGFYVNWLTESGTSYQTVQENWQSIDMIAPFWYTLTPEGELENRYGGHQYEAMNLAQNRQVEILPLINNSQANNLMLVDPTIRKKSINNIVKLVQDYQYDGVNIDFEMLPEWTRDGYTNFIKELSAEFDKINKKLTISVFPKIDVPISLQGAYDYGALAPYIDRLVIMTYDNHWSTGPAGPVAPLQWVEKNIIYALEYLPPEKVLLGIANYGYDWVIGGEGSDLSEKEATQLASKYNAEIKWHNTYQVPYFNYQDEIGNKHQVWFENNYSLGFKLELVNKYNLKGIGIWRLGNGSKDFWKIINKLLGKTN